MPKVRYSDGTEIFVPATDPDSLESAYQDYKGSQATVQNAPMLQQGTREYASRHLNPQGLIPDPVVKYGFPVAGFAAGMGLSRVKAGGHIGAGLGAAAGQMELNRRARMTAAKQFLSGEDVQIPEQPSPVTAGLVTAGGSAAVGGAFRAGKGLFNFGKGMMRGFKTAGSSQLADDVTSQAGQYRRGLGTEFEGTLSRQAGTVDLNTIGHYMRADMQDPMVGKTLMRAAEKYSLEHGDTALLDLLEGKAGDVTALQAQHIKNALKEFAPEYAKQVDFALVKQFPGVAQAHSSYGAGIEKSDLLEKAPTAYRNIIPGSSTQSARWKAAKEILNPKTYEDARWGERAEGFKKGAAGLAKRLLIPGGIGYGLWASRDRK